MWRMANFCSSIMEFGTKDEKALQKLTSDVMDAFGMQYSASHTEFIKANEDGKFYFLETSSRVGGANLAEMVDFSSGVNLWYEWARLEVAVAEGKKYKLPKVKNDYAGIIVSLARQKHPDTSHIKDAEIVWRLNMEHHVGLIVKSATASGCWNRWINTPISWRKNTTRRLPRPKSRIIKLGREKAREIFKIELL